MINNQQWPCCQWSMICALIKATVNSELQNLTLVSLRQLGTLENRATTGTIRFELSSNSGLFLELRLEDHWCHHYSTFFFQSSQLSWKHHKSRECQTLMTKIDDKICPRRTATPASCSSEHSTTRWVQKCIVCCCINYVIWQGYMYTVAKKVILSVCCVVSCLKNMWITLIMWSIFTS